MRRELVERGWGSMVASTYQHVLNIPTCDDGSINIPTCVPYVDGSINIPTYPDCHKRMVEN
jgi:hypothetical protein